MPLRKRPWILGLGVAAAGLLGWVVWQAQQAVVTIRFMPRQQGTVIDSLFVTVGAEKQSAARLKSGDIEHFTFEPQPEYPLVLGFWIGDVNQGWEGPVLRARQRLEVTLGAGDRVIWSECDWPCWGTRRVFSEQLDK